MGREFAPLPATGPPVGEQPGLSYRDWATRLLEMGYEPLPIKPRTKEAVAKGWTTVHIDAAQVEAWASAFPDHGIGLRTGWLVAIDIDVLDPDCAHGLQALAVARFGPTLMRVGLWPKHLLLYRTDVPFVKMKVGQVEVLAQGQQFVAFGIHPKTQKPYGWPFGETPLDVAFDQLPLITKRDIEAFLAEAAALFPAEETGSRRRESRAGVQSSGHAPVRDKNGLVIDGRDGWLSSIAYHAVWDAMDAGGTPEPVALADRVWDRFAETTDLTRGKKDGEVGYSRADALQKVRDKLGLAKKGRLPARNLTDLQPVVVEPGLPLEEARARLDAVIGEFATRAEAWHANSQVDAAPRIGIRASVGLGKTAVSRRHLLELQARLKADGLPHRLLIVTPSLALADESAAAWRQGDLKVAVHRGYEAKQPGRKEIMCRDIDMVRMATKAGLPVFPNTCLRKGGVKCHAFELCPKQWNRDDVEKADIVLAAYDALYTGLPVSPEKLALVLIDEGCWVRSVKETGLYLHDLRQPDAVDEQRSGDADHEAEAWAALFALRYKAADALQANGRGPLSRQVLLDKGLSVSDCATAGVMEIQLRVDPGLRPGMYQSERKKAFELSKAAQKSVAREALFLAMERLLAGEAEQDGRIVLRPSDPETGVQAIKVMGLHQIDPALASLPILHLDATLRPDLAETVLPGLEVTEITAAMPHMRLKAVQGRFGKTTLVQDAKASRAENTRRANRLRECVNHVRWEAARVSPRTVLVVTHIDLESAFAGIPNVSTGHFNAIAGLDIYKDVALLIVIGRPMPSEDALAELSGVHLGHVPQGKLVERNAGLLMREGTRRAYRVRQHEDPTAELLRAAICDDEIVQAIGRGRGVNRTVDNPLEVQVLADVALPMLHDRVVAWESILPDLLQRMLLAGIAVDSPADAAVLHPDMFENEKQAQKAMERWGFKRHFPMSNTYRGMSLKSARYRRSGRGRSWQTAYWISVNADVVRAEMVSALGPLDGWSLG
ncbi:bifunctional DNA primase/polymerase [Neogemmobacter tilapiae]|uniref:DNA primase/polymerase bifunctional N-terminal domain-containing protein n=1 Tax=Neogemmobacter tilapiae TaxID=875041 RepID=A0A918TYW2_9RHOB|nr:bifunctional DNA primase/polymerase [Gemmobacter tilapiae]GHC66377.1 hypothetical protein GCM10007315_33860 [Gemmobacter tilapiae]